MKEYRNLKEWAESHIEEEGYSSDTTVWCININDEEEFEDSTLEEIAEGWMGEFYDSEDLTPMAVEYVADYIKVWCEW